MQNFNEQICTLLKQHNTKGMECLFAVYYKPLVLWGATFLRDIDRAEDLVQDFFIKLWESKSVTTLMPETLKSYLFISIRNLALNAAVKIDPLRHTCDLAHFERPWEEYDDFEDEVIRWVREEVDKLPPRSQEVIKCVYLKGMRYKDVAEELNISVATVNTLLVNALKRLRQVSGENEEMLICLLCASACTVSC